jgi:hypothetical protein
MQATMTLPTIQIRVARPDDEATLLRLAALDSAPALSGDVLVALVDGEILAATAIDSGRVIADPFRHTADLVELLRTRAHLLGERGSETGRKRHSLRRLASPIALAR